MRITLVCSAFLLVAACAARPPQLVAPDQTERQARDDHTMCMVAGIKQNTPAFDDCRRKLYAAQQEAISRRPAGKAAGEPVRATTRITITPGRPTDPPAAPPRQP